MDNRFANESVREYLEQLGSGTPTPGGGAAAALSSAQGAALIMMVANHAINNDKYAEFADLNTKIRDEASSLRERLLAGMDRDAECFDKVMAAYILPNTIAGSNERYLATLRAFLQYNGIGSELTDQDVADARMASLASASVEAAKAPLAVMEESHRGLELAKILLDTSGSNFKSDVYTAALSLSAGLSSAGYMVAANLPAIRRTDPGLADRLSLRSQTLRAESEILLREILNNQSS